MFVVGVWIVVAVLIVSLIASIALRGGQLSTNDLIGLLAIAVGILVAFYSERLPVPAPVADAPGVTAVPSPALSTIEAYVPTNNPEATTPPTESLVVAVDTPVTAPRGTETASKPEPLAVVTSTLQPDTSATNTPEPVATATDTTRPTEAPSATPGTPVSMSTPPATTEEVRITVEGIGAAPATMTNTALRERAAFSAAESDAKHKLTAWAAGEEIESLTITEQGVLSIDTIRLYIKAQVPPSTVIDRKYDPETGTAWVKLESAVSKQSSP